MKDIMLTSLLCAAFVAMPAQATDWKQIAVDARVQHDGNSRVIEIDLDSINRTAAEISVMERETQMSIGGTGYSCREGDIRHGLTDQATAAIFCRKDIPDHFPGHHTPVWVPYKTQGKDTEVQYDSAALYRIHDYVPVSERTVTISVYRVSYDCRGYYRRSTEWIWLDTTDKIAMVPRGYVSPERQVSNWVCSNKPHS